MKEQENESVNERENESLRERERVLSKVFSILFLLFLGVARRSQNSVAFVFLERFSQVCEAVRGVLTRGFDCYPHGKENLVYAGMCCLIDAFIHWPNGRVIVLFDLLVAGLLNQLIEGSASWTI